MNRAGRMPRYRSTKFRQSIDCRLGACGVARGELRPTGKNRLQPKRIISPFLPVCRHFNDQAGSLICSRGQHRPRLPMLPTTWQRANLLFIAFPSRSALHHPIRTATLLDPPSIRYRTLLASLVARCFGSFFILKLAALNNRQRSMAMVTRLQNHCWNTNGIL